MSRSLFPRARPTKAAKKPAELPPVKGVHVFVDSGAKDVFGNELCEECGSIRKARVHSLPETPPDAAEIDARRVPD